MADRLASDHHPGQVVVVCGTNEKTKQALDGHSWPGEGSGVTVRVLGFVANMDEWMTASDLLVTKASNLSNLSAPWVSHDLPPLCRAGRCVSSRVCLCAT